MPFPTILTSETVNEVNHAKVHFKQFRQFYTSNLSESYKFPTGSANVCMIFLYFFMFFFPKYGVTGSCDHG